MDSSLKFFVKGKISYKYEKIRCSDTYNGSFAITIQRIAKKIKLKM